MYSKYHFSHANIVRNLGGSYVALAATKTLAPTYSVVHQSRIIVIDKCFKLKKVAVSKYCIQFVQCTQLEKFNLPDDVNTRTTSTFFMHIISIVGRIS
jgi:hypothetical protein